MPTNRNLTYDLMKGVAILLMMISHAVLRDTGPINHFIYSFHMPLFFILAGMFAKELGDIPSFWLYTKKNAKRLLLPFVMTMLLRCAWGGLQAIMKHDIAYLLQPTLSMLVASPDEWDTQWGLVYTGPMWFLIALFWVRELFYGLQYVLKTAGERYRDILMVGVSILLSVAAVLVYPLVQPLPFCIIQAFAAIAFYALGWYIRKHPMPKWVYGLSILVWPFAIMYGHITMAFCGISYYPLSFIGACGGTYVVYLLCRGIETYLTNVRIINLFPKALAWCGIFSLPILCMHELELYSAFLYSIICKVPQMHFLVGWGEIVIAIVMAIIVINIPYLRNVYR